MSLHRNGGVGVVVINGTAFHIPQRVDAIDTFVHREFFHSTTVGTFGTAVRAQADGLIQIVYAGTGIVVVGIVHLSAHLQPVGDVRLDTCGQYGAVIIVTFYHAFLVGIST